MGTPGGGGPTRETPWSARSKALAARIETTTATSTAGTFGDQPLERGDDDQAEQADGQRRRHRLAVGQPLGEAGRFRDESVGIDREAEQFWELADEDREGEAVHVADLGRLGQQVGHEAQLGDAGEHGHHPDQQREHRGERDGTLRIPIGSDDGDDGGGDHGPERGVRPQHQDPGGAEDGVADQAQDGGVQPSDRRQARQLGIGHPLGDQQRRQDQPGDQVLGEPATPIRREQTQPGRHRAQLPHPHPSPYPPRASLPSPTPQAVMAATTSTCDAPGGVEP